MKKIVGYIFVVIGVFLVYAIVSQAPTTLRTLMVEPKSYEGNLDAYVVSGAITGLLILLVLAVACLFFGFRFIKKAKKESSIRK